MCDDDADAQACMWILCAIVSCGMGDPWRTPVDAEEGIFRSWMELGSLREDVGKDISGTYSSAYVVAFYWSITTMTTVGYGDVTPVNNTEMASALRWRAVLALYSPSR